MGNTDLVLQYGPCQCRTPASETSSFDYVWRSRTAPNLGTTEEYLVSWVGFFASTNVDECIKTHPVALAPPVLAHVLSATLKIEK